MKRKIITQIIQKDEIDVLCIQESKMSKLDSRVYGELWGDCEVEKREMEAVNCAGGVVMMWGKGNFQINDQFLGSNVVGLKGIKKEEVEETVIMNVYSSCNMTAKGTL